MPRIIIPLVASVLFLGASTVQASGEDEVAFAEVLVGDFGLFYDGPSDLVIRNQRQWCEFWEQAHDTRADPPSCDLSLLDFRHEVVIASAIAGGNGCYRIDITGIEAEPGRGELRVFARDTVPDRHCICTQAMVFRVQAVVVSRPVGRVRFIHETATLQCER